MTCVVVDAVLLRLAEFRRDLHGVGYAVTAYDGCRVVDIPCEVLGEILLLVDGISLDGHEYRVVHDCRVMRGHNTVFVLSNGLCDESLLRLAGDEQGQCRCRDYFHGCSHNIDVFLEFPEFPEFPACPGGVADFPEFPEFPGLITSLSHIHVLCASPICPALLA